MAHILTLILSVLVLVLFVIEALVIRHSVDHIPHRIHVNGTRGKSGTTAYIAAALRASGMRTMAKVTGEIPSLIMEDGSRQSIRRRGPARVQEQFRIIRRASRRGSEALVLECMSIDPALQETESRHFRPQIYVLTNIRDDHREKMGRTPGEQLVAMCRAIPENCTLVCGDRENLEAIRREAERKNCRLVIPKDWVPGAEPELPFGVFPDNLALAVEVAVLCGISREKALEAILEEIGETASPVFGEFLNAFPVNDPASAGVYFDVWRKNKGMPAKILLVFNTRADRPERTDAFIPWIRDRRSLFSGIFITGDHRARAYARLKDLRPDLELSSLKPRQIKGLRHTLHERHGAFLPVVGIGNMGGTGTRVLKEFQT